MAKTRPPIISIPGYYPVAGVPIEEYKDFVGQHVSLRLLKMDLRAGNYPPGLIVQDGTGAYQVFGEQGQPQVLYPLTTTLRIA